MLREAGVRTLLHVSENGAAYSWLENELNLNVLSVDAGTGQLRDIRTCQSPIELDLSETRPDDAAYIFFTSGTTGLPKGVLGSHRGLSHFLNWQRETFAVSPRDRCAQLTGLSFDVVLRDIFLPLTSGAILCLPADDFTPDSDSVLSWLDGEQISLLHTVPALAQSWLAGFSSGASLRAMRYVFFAGEPLTDALVREWRDTFPESGEIINLYGPTETTLAKCYYRVQTGVLPGIQPLGRPLPQTQALVMGPNDQMCGIGEPGEIVIRTPYRSLGYINAPEENRQRFYRNPFGSDDADLLYSTGDRGRYRPDGSIDIMGRLDDQVKIRGVRVEPAEVAAVLARHADIKACHVVSWDDENNQSRLVAYAVMDNNTNAEISHLRTYLSDYLPSVMIPDLFVLLDHLPLTPNGKVDRKALPHPDTACLTESNAFVPPRTPIEQALADIWANVLGLEQQIGVHDNFFRIGGHSLKATQVISRIRNLFQVEIPLRALFEAPTVAGLAQDLVQHCYVLSENRTGLADVLSDLETLSEVEAVRLIEQ
jgi:amino acid adenylation domain-containing protein